jgi:hypothetical protein
MTEDEARERCGERGLRCRFTVTADPKDVAGRAGSGSGAVAKVIRACEEDGVVSFLLGYFTPGKRESGEDG